MKRRALLLCIPVLAGTCILSGCRESMNITQVIYDKESTDVDAVSEVNDTPDSEDESENLPVRKQEEADRDDTTFENSKEDYEDEDDTPADDVSEDGTEEETDEDAPLQSSGQSEQESEISVAKVPKQVEGDGDSGETDTAQASDTSTETAYTDSGEGTEETDGSSGDAEDDGSTDDAEDDGSTGDGDETEDSSSGDNSGGSTGSNEDDSANAESDEEDSSGSGSGGQSENKNTRQVVNENGEVVSVPEDVNSVVAPGAAAVMVMMLGGDGILYGASSDVLDGMASEVFADEGIADAIAYWDGDGSAVMTDESFAELLEAEPDVCVALSGQSNFSDEQIEELSENGIAYMTIPDFTSVDNILEAVDLLGDTIGNRTDAGGQNAKTIARSYTNYVEDLIADVKSDCGQFSARGLDYNTGSSLSSPGEGVFTSYIYGWDEDTTVSISGSVADGSYDIAYEEEGAAYLRRSYTWSPVSYFLSIAGVDNYAAEMSSSTSADYYFIAMPLNINVYYANYYDTGSWLNYYGYESFDASTSFPHTTYSFAYVNIGDYELHLGEDLYKQIIVDSQDTKSNIESSYMWDLDNHSTRSTSYRNWLITQDGEEILSNIYGEYEILVNPSGVYPWAYGSPESVLESVWAAWCISGDYTESRVKEEVSEFYSEFYRYDLTDAQVEDILDGD